MADKTALAESSQALFCAIADYIGSAKTNRLFDTEKYPDYVEFRKALGAVAYKTALKRVITPGVGPTLIDKFLNENNDWYKSSVLIGKKLLNSITEIDSDYKIKAPGFQKLFYFRGDQEVMGNIEGLFKIANKSPVKGQAKFGNVNKWSPADIYLASEKAKKIIKKTLSTAKPGMFSFVELNIMTSDMIDTGDLLPLSLKKTTKDVILQKVNFDKKEEIKMLKKISISPKRVTDWKPYKKVKYGQKAETRDMRVFLNNKGEIKFRHDPSAKRFVAEFIGSGAEARAGSIGSMKVFCELFRFVDKNTASKLLKAYNAGEVDYFKLLKKIEFLRSDKKRFDFERGAISAVTIINKIMPILKPWFKRTKPKDVEQINDFIRIMYQYITSRTPLSGKFVIAK